MTVRPLTHVTSRRRVRNWRKAKLCALATADAYTKISAPADIVAKHKRLAARIAECSNRLEFVQDENDHLVLANGFSCGARQCPLCQASNARKSYAILAGIIERHANLYPRSLPCMLTLTVKNVPAEQLGGTLSQMNAAFAKMRRMKAFKRAVIGWRRSTEVTRNADSDSYHPHFHCLLMMADGYWQSGNYLQKDQWQEMWQKTLGHPLAIVDIRRKGRDRNGFIELSGDDGLQEFAKYLVKPQEVYIETETGWQVDAPVLAALHDGLKSRRLCDYGGTLRKIPRPDKPPPFAKDVKMLGYVWSRIEDANGDVHEANYWPEHLLQDRDELPGTSSPPL